ncbi:restriction endonuclease [Proteiniborus sp. MB09-C3]|uniref:restriction endonuclease n=1 Tax=Proteiniborus sp. MB09-C3 TaxID=3050072 RepID=UPI002553EB20|nr:restriction endonuclease [Proteiniborus sp. MB09-C3]WIV11109.1 restriction endonuclease [Proteiniborus sp. MB09-C3]
MDPGAFERLAQRLLRESGFVQVEVTGRTGDGGIYGKGIVRLNGILSFHTIFQCKKMSGKCNSKSYKRFQRSNAR